MPEPLPSRQENTLLIAATRDDPAWAGGAGAFDAAYVLRAAARQGVGALLHHWLDRRAGGDASTAITTDLHLQYWAEHFRNRQLLDELDAILRRAGEAGIDVMPLKGAWLARTFYRTPALRPLSDLDVLVRPGDERRLGEVLHTLGFTEVSSGPSYVEDAALDRQSLEHCWIARRSGLDVLVEFRVAPLELTVARLADLDDGYRAAIGRYTASVWDRSVPGHDGVGRVMSAEDLLIHVTTHMAAKHVDFRLIWLHDIARIVAGAPALDWARVAALASDLRVTAPVVAALEAARRYAAAAITEAQVAQVRAGLGRPSPWSWPQRDLRQLLRCVDALPTWDLTWEGPRLWPLEGALSRVRGIRARARVMRWVLLPSKDYLAHRGPAGRGRLVRLLSRFSSRRP